MRRIGKRIIAIGMAALLGIGLCLQGGIGENGVIPAKAANQTDSLGHQIVNRASSYLGCGYSLASRTGPTSFDCSGLVWTVLSDCGISGSPITTMDWVSQITQKSLNLYYGSTKMECVYCDSLSAYQQAVNASDNAGKFVVLSAPCDWNSIANAGGLIEGSICINPAETAGAYGHASIIVGELSYQGTIQTFERFSDTQAQYENQAMGYVRQNYSACSTRPTLGVTAFPGFVTSAHANLDALSATAPANSHNAVAGAIVVEEGGGLDANGNGTLGSKFWRIDASNVNAGVRLSNTVGGKTGNTSTYAVTYVTQKSTYAKVGLKKVDQANVQKGDAIYAIFSLTQTNNTPAKAQAAIEQILSANQTLAAKKKALLKAFPDAEILTTSASKTVYSRVFESSQGADTMTYYVTELSAPEHYLRDDSLYRLTLHTSANATGKGATIQSLSVAVKGSYGKSIATASESSFDVMIGTDYSYYARVGIEKKNQTEAAVKGAVYVLVKDSAKNATKTLDALTLAYGTTKYDELLQGTESIVLKTSTSLVDSKAIQLGKNASATYYMKEVYAPSNYEIDSNIYRIDFTGVRNNTTGYGSKATLKLYRGTEPKITLTNGTNFGILSATDLQWYLNLKLKKIDAISMEPVNGAGYVLFATKDQMEQFVKDRDAYLLAHSAASRTMVYQALLQDDTGVLRRYLRVLNINSDGMRSASSALTEANSDVNNEGICHGYLVEYYAPKGYQLDAGYHKLTFRAGTKTDGSDCTVLSDEYFASLTEKKGTANTLSEDGAVLVSDQPNWHGTLAIEKIDHQSGEPVAARYVLAMTYEDLMQVVSDMNLYQLANPTASKEELSVNVLQNNPYVLADLVLEQGMTVQSDVFHPTQANSDVNMKNGQMTVYLMEYDVMEGYVAENGYHMLLLQTTEDEEGKGSQILDATYIADRYQQVAWDDVETSEVSLENRKEWIIDGNTVNVRYQIQEEPKQVYGCFCIQKVDQNQEPLCIAGIGFDIYRDKDCTDLITTALTNEAGIATYVCEAPWYQREGARTVYVKENATTVPDAYHVNPDVYRVVVTGGSTVEQCKLQVWRLVASTTEGHGGIEDVLNGEGHGGIEDTLDGEQDIAQDIEQSVTELTFVLPNEQKDRYIKIGLEKVDAMDGMPIDQTATYAFCTENEYVAAEGDLSLVQYETISIVGAKGYSLVRNIEKEEQITCYLWELIPPEGYECDPNLYRFVVQGTYDASGSGCQIVSVEENKQSLLRALTTDEKMIPIMTMADQKISMLQGGFEIEKVDETTALKDVCYGLYQDPNCEKQLTVLSTDENGIAAYQLPDWEEASGTTQTLYMKELSTDAYHIQDNDCYQIVVTGANKRGDCTVVITNLRTGQPLKETSLAYRKQHQNESIEVAFMKLRSVQGEVIYQGEVPMQLAGCTMQILDQEGTVIETFATKEQAITIRGKLALGQTYRLHELSAAEGYCLSEDIEFTVKERDNLVCMIDEQMLGKVLVEKLSNSMEPIKNVRFGIYQSETNTLVSEFVTDETGHGESDLLPIYASESDCSTPISYELRELETIDGFVLEEAARAVTFVLDQEAKPVVVTRFTIINQIQKGTLRLTKVNEANQPIAGVVFALICNETGQRYEQTTDADGIAAWEDMPLGTMNKGVLEPYHYTLMEVMAAAGYQKEEQSWQITLLDEAGETVCNRTIVNKALSELPATGGNHGTHTEGNNQEAIYPETNDFTTRKRQK